MGLAQVNFETVDEPTRREAEAMARSLEAAGPNGTTLHLKGRVAEIFRSIAATSGRVGGLAYGGLSSELTPEQAGRILGVCRVPWSSDAWTMGVYRSGYEGAHRRCKLEDVLKRLQI